MAYWVNRSRLSMPPLPGLGLTDRPAPLLLEEKGLGDEVHATKKGLGDEVHATKKGLGECSVSIECEY